MDIPLEFLYPPSLEEAVEIQRQLAVRVVREDVLPKDMIIGGMDVSNNPRDPKQIIHATVVVLDKNLQVCERTSVSKKQNFPYISGFLGFREAPTLVDAYQQLKYPPTVIFVDGHGVSHPRGLGIASHIGVLLDCVTIGVAKSLLVGKPQTLLGPMPGDQTPVIFRGQVVAMMLRTKLRCKPLIISTGHQVSLSTAVTLVQQCLRGYRLPEPTRQAHLAANAQRRGMCTIFDL